MNIFKNLVGKNPTEKNEQLHETAICKTEQELLEYFGGIAFEKQNHFGKIIGSNNWNFDMKTGEISFGDNQVFPLQILGTFSHSTETWLWAWANTGSGIPENLLTQALKLKNYGEKNEIDLLTVAEFEATKNDLHLIGMIASGMFDTSGYYLANYGQGTMCVTVKSEKIDNSFDDSHYQILTTFPQFISAFEMNHKNALKNYLQIKGYEIQEFEKKIVGKKNEQTINAEFDDLARLTNLKG